MRYRSAKEQKETIRGLKDGTVDIVVGTHRLLSDDVKFKDLGLVIIDEEQRFGVKHKEKLKENFIGVDMLTLSATPIPRTLNMALSGIRDMSTIEQPPFERQPIETYVLEYDDAIIAEAIRRELARGGQVYYLYNRVETIEQCAAKVQKLVPGARVGIAHGKMTEEQISSVWQQLLDTEIDVLVCTTLLEAARQSVDGNCLQAAFSHPGVYLFWFRVPHCDARFTDPRRGQPAGPQPARPHGSGWLRAVCKNAEPGHCSRPRRACCAGQE